MRNFDYIAQASKIKQKHMAALIIKFPLENNGLNYGVGGCGTGEEQFDKTLKCEA